MGSGQQGRREGREGALAGPFNLHAGIQPISDSNSGLGPFEAALRSMACPHGRRNRGTEGRRDSYNCVCRVWSNPSRNRHSQPLLSLSAMDCGPVNLARSLVIRFAFLPECDDEKGRGGVVWVGTQHETGA